MDMRSDSPASYIKLSANQGRRICLAFGGLSETNAEVRPRRTLLGMTRAAFGRPLASHQSNVVMQAEGHHVYS